MTQKKKAPSRWMQLSPEEKQKILQRKYAREKAKGRHGMWKGRKHWTETATPEQLQAWKDKIKAGRDKFWSGQKGTPGRPKKFNYRKGWDPSAKSAATKAIWVWRDKYRPDIKERFIRNGRKAAREKWARLKPLRDEARWAKENNLAKVVRANHQEEAKKLYELAKTVLGDSGIEPEPNMPIEYYKDIINFFKPGTV